MPKWELKCITQRNNIICWHHKSRASQKSSIPAQQIQRTGARKRACRGETGRSVSTKHMRTDESSSTVHTSSQATPSSRHHAETRHPGTTDAAHRHTRELGQKWNGPKPTRRARAHCPATLQHRVGRRRTCSDERRHTLVLRESFWPRSSVGSSDVVTFYW